MTERGGDLVGALTVDEDDEVLVVFEKGNIVRSRVDEVRLTGRNTMGVQFAKPGRNDAIVAVARNPEKEVEEAVEAAEAAAGVPASGTDGGAGVTDAGAVADDGVGATADDVSLSDGTPGTDVADEPGDAVPSDDDA
jgi:DNA gyrase subunit A